MRQLIKHGIYKHFKGNFYAVVGIARSFKLPEGSTQLKYINTEITKPFQNAVDCTTEELSYVPIYTTPKGEYWQEEKEEDVVIYVNLYASEKWQIGTLFARPLEEFLSETDHEKYPNVKQKYRFEEVITEQTDTCRFCGGELHKAVEKRDFARYDCNNCLSRLVVKSNSVEKTINWLRGQSGKIIFIFPYMEKEVKEYTDSIDKDCKFIDIEKFKYEEKTELQDVDYPNKLIKYIKDNINDVPYIFIPLNVKIMELINKVGLEYYLFYPATVERDSMISTLSIINSDFEYNSDEYKQFKKDVTKAYDFSMKIYTNDKNNKGVIDFDGYSTICTHLLRFFSDCYES